MMKIFHHRINTSSQLVEIPPADGVEIDIRSSGQDIILEHEPFKEGQLLTQWLKHWQGQSLILNIKEEGIEERTLDALHAYPNLEYFFLDQSFPFLARTINSGNKKTAVRVSDLESVDTALLMNCDWVWIDCFLGDWNFLPGVVRRLQDNGKKICLVSPELVRDNAMNELQLLQDILKDNNLFVQGVCTKLKALWDYHDF
jgi:hypothetical protein